MRKANSFMKRTMTPLSFVVLLVFVAPASASSHFAPRLHEPPANPAIEPFEILSNVDVPESAIALRTQAEPNPIQNKEKIPFQPESEPKFQPVYPEIAPLAKSLPFAQPESLFAPIRLAVAPDHRPAAPVLPADFEVEPRILAANYPACNQPEVNPRPQTAPRPVLSPREEDRRPDLINAA